MDNPGEILRLCRLCLVKDQVNIPIFEEQGDIRQTFLKIRSCLPVKVSRDDKLPKKICGGCSNKLDLFYEFWSSTANSEKTLQSWLGQEEEDDKMQEITKPVEALVKEESEALEDGHAHDQSFDEATKDEAEAPPAKRARRTAAVKAQINISHDSDEDEDVDGAEPITKIEDESDDSDGEEKDPSYTEVPGTSADDQAGPSGLGKDGVEAPFIQFQCSKCQLTFITEKIWVQHQLSCLYKKCETCGRQVEQNRLYRHMRSHKKPKFNCTACGKIFKENFQLKRHTLTVHERRDRCPCYVCGKIFNSRRNAEAHVKKYHTKEFKVYCEECGLGFVGASYLNAHKKVKHRKEKAPLKLFHCSSEGCDKTYYSKSSLDNHMYLHDTIKQSFSCPHCSKAFECPRPLKRHLKVHHSGGPSHYTCKLCGKKLKTSAGLKMHLRSHTGQKPHACHYCDKSFVSQSYLKVHLLVHTTQKPYECAVCTKQFTQRGNAITHFRKNHPGGSLDQIVKIKIEVL
ncbi:zinc finger protein OZF-like isoform X43 [Euwallacea similis]|uniref:zinc finger protein OZF-like isoform X43 n=1 Tax=Euwallacea similis TaxID=1736056 RepID=UPI00344FADCC